VADRSEIFSTEQFSCHLPKSAVEFLKCVSYFCRQYLTITYSFSEQSTHILKYIKNFALSLIGSFKIFQNNRHNNYGKHKRIPALGVVVQCDIVHVLVLVFVHVLVLVFVHASTCVRARANTCVRACDSNVFMHTSTCVRACASACVRACDSNVFVRVLVILDMTVPNCLVFRLVPSAIPVYKLIMIDAVGVQNY
jgi:hypothetical protein